MACNGFWLIPKGQFPGCIGIALGCRRLSGQAHPKPVDRHPSSDQLDLSSVPATGTLPDPAVTDLGRGYVGIIRPPRCPTTDEGPGLTPALPPDLLSLHPDQLSGLKGSDGREDLPMASAERLGQLGNRGPPIRLQRFEDGALCRSDASAHGAKATD